MSYSSNLTRNRILDCAKKEFIEKGFLKGSMRTIAFNSKVTTGAIYNHFKNKESLFEAIVEDVGNNMLSLFKEEHSKFKKITDYFENDAESYLNNGTYNIIDFIYKYFEEVTLLVCHSSGSKFENFIQELVTLEEKLTLNGLKDNGIILNDSELFFIHVISSMGVESLLKIVRHNLKKEESIEYMKKIQEFYFAGWKKVLKF